MLNSTRPRPSLRASGTLPSEAIQWGMPGTLPFLDCFVASLLAMTGGLLNTTRQKACSAVWLSPLVAAC
ncbi:MAG: hypothetical protein LBT00_11420 [Spirochaetaceae bacterium]|nr:hypothetical protein [Spirochaetaceae bacterium]